MELDLSVYAHCGSSSLTYHRMIGIDHFYLLVAEPFENIQNTMPQYEKDITYVPYNYTWTNHKHNGNRNMITNVWGWRAQGEIWFQNSANNQCLNLAKHHGLDWVITPDADEWVAVQDPSIPHFTTPPPLKQYFEKYHPKPTATTQVKVSGGGWGRHPQLETKTSKFELTIDFTYRRDRKLGNENNLETGAGACGRLKCFYNVDAVEHVRIHAGVQEGVSKGEVANTDHIELNHFRNPWLGVPRNTRGDVKADQLVSYPELRDMYRDKLDADLRRLNWAFPDFKAHSCFSYCGK